jgi:hypothetical protein
MTSSSSEIKQDSIHGTKCMLFEFELREQLQKQTAGVHNTLCEGIILQKRFVKKSN